MLLNLSETGVRYVQLKGFFNFLISIQIRKDELI